MNDAAISIKTHLGGNSNITFDLNVGQFPSTPDKAIVITPAGGRPPYPHLALNFPAVQIMVRGKPSGYLEASQEMSDICDVLLGMGTTLLTNDTYRSCNQMGDVIYLGQDERGRPIFSANFWFIVEPSSLGNRVEIH